MSKHSPLERVLILKGTELFSETPDEILDDVAAVLREVELEPGQVVFREGVIGHSTYVVAEGRVTVSVGGETIRDLEEGEIFGELAAIDPAPRSATVTAAEPTVLFRIGDEILFELIADRFELAQGIFRVLCRRIRARSREVREIELDDG